MELSEKAKIKVPYVLAMLAALISLNQIPADIKSFGFDLFNHKFTVNGLYIVTATALAISAYFYSIDLVTEKKFIRFAAHAGHAAYAMSILMPPAFIIGYIISAALAYVKNSDLRQVYINIANYISLGGSLIGMMASIILLYVQIKMKTDMAEKNQLQREANEMLSKAKLASKNDLHDLTVIASWQLIEYIVENLGDFSSKTNTLVGIRDFLNDAKSKKQITQELYDSILKLKILRNQVAHNKKKATQDDAQSAIAIAEQFSLFVFTQEEECFYCNKKNKISTMKTHSVLGDRICSNCEKLHPDWENEMISMGMDP